MNHHARQQYAAILGKAVFAHIILKQQRLVSLGLFRNDERDDIVQELALTCIKALERNYKPADADRSTYLITCVNCRAKTLAMRRVKEKAHLVLSGDIVQAYDEDGDDLLDKRQDNTTHTTISAKIDLDQLLALLPDDDREIVRAIAQGKTPTAACRSKGRCNTYFIRHIRPLIKNLLKKLN